MERVDPVRGMEPQEQADAPPALLRGTLRVRVPTRVHLPVVYVRLVCQQYGRGSSPCKHKVLQLLLVWRHQHEVLPGVYCFGFYFQVPLTLPELLHTPLGGFQYGVYGGVVVHTAGHARHVCTQQEVRLVRVMMDLVLRDGDLCVMGHYRNMHYDVCVDSRAVHMDHPFGMKLEAWPLLHGQFRVQRVDTTLTQTVVLPSGELLTTDFVVLGREVRHREGAFAKFWSLVVLLGLRGGPSALVGLAPSSFHPFYPGVEVTHKLVVAVTALRETTLPETTPQWLMCDQRCGKGAGAKTGGVRRLRSTRLVFRLPIQLFAPEAAAEHLVVLPRYEERGEPAVHAAGTRRWGRSVHPPCYEEVERMTVG